MGSAIFISIAVAILFIITLISGVRIVRQSTVKVVERLGKYHKILETGINIIVPFLDKIRKIKVKKTRTDYQGRTFLFSTEVDYIDLRERVYDFPGQGVITKDNVTLEIDALLYYQITDPFKSVYEIEDIALAIEKLTQTTLRNVIGELELDQTLTSRDTINTKLRLILDEATDKWGVKVTRVELKDIVPPTEIRKAMEKQMIAERAKREKILLAEGEKQQKILVAEGERDKLIAEATGTKKQKILVAEGESQAIELIKNALGTETLEPAQYLIAIKYIESLKEIAGQTGEKVIFLPFESSALLSSLGSLKEIFTNSTKK